MASHIDDDRAGQQQDVVFSVSSLNSVRIRPAEPFFGDPGHSAGASLEGVLVVPKVPFSDQIIWSGDIHRKGTVKEGEQILRDDGSQFARPVNFVRWAPGKEFLFDVRQLALLHILERKLIPQGKYLAIDQE